VSRIDKTLTSLAETGSRALVPYVVCGDPDLDATIDVMHAMVEKGANIIELGVPFSDPMAEGPVIQKGHERALVHGTSLRQTLEVVSRFRKQDNDTPVVLMGYANPVERMGYTTFAQAAREAGVDGVLTVDLPPEEAGELHDELKKVDIDIIFLLAPTTTDDRAARICEMASGYLYYVSLKGVTGAGHLDTEEVSAKVKHIKTFTSLPVCVGFGIKDAESARSIAAVSDGVVVGSVLVNMLGNSGSAAVGQVAELIGDIRSGIDKVSRG
jgi:tryptophan synthase alpha chain